MPQSLDEGTRGQIVGMRASERGDLISLPIPGRPKKLNDCHPRQLACVVQQNICKKLAKIKKHITIYVSINTLGIAIHKDLGKQSCIAVKKPYLSPVHMEQQLKFAWQHLSSTIEQWSRVIWTDESSFKLGKWSTRTRVWCTPQEKYELESITINHQSGQRSFMRSAINFISNVYKPSLIPFYNELIDAGVAENYNQLTLMEDGTPIHTAQVSNDWRQFNNIHKLQWPANSPDLNPIENLWFKMRYMVTNLFNPKTMEELKAAVNAAWGGIPFEHLYNILVSMPHRMQAVVNARGAPV
ncbi:hypothetical protein O181_027955 [Austropuccinia psidii MF-1]|uniref:Tc1-like transposase DDE domain-containing protein n=1 Tax=Austropuccinia psidii MF-1 TaxID=1389203 RepID=A0A9Q3CSC6_9BASI|nr:hypothetical protein [Austropuccinia psidii MF-1]